MSLIYCLILRLGQFIFTFYQQFQNNKRRPPPITFIPNENARNLPTFTIGKDSIKKSLKHGPTEPSLDFSGFVPLTRRGPLMIEDSFARPTNRIPLKPNFRQR